MKKTLPLVILLLITITVRNYAQDALTYKTDNSKTSKELTTGQPPVFEFKAYSRDYELDLITPEMAGEHLMGNLIAKKLYLLDKKYTSEKPVVPGNPMTKTVIQKPVIYDAVKRIERHLKREAKKGNIANETAITNMHIVLDVALNILTTDTEVFEESLESRSDIDARIDLFVKGVRLVY